MNKIETNMNMKTITITNDFICYQQGGIGKEIINAIEELQQEIKQLKERIDKLKNELIKDRMEQFDDYVIYLQNKYLEMLGDSND